jgi:hypothetical protein
MERSWIRLLSLCNNEDTLASMPGYQKHLDDEKQ